MRDRQFQNTLLANCGGGEATHQSASLASTRLTGRTAKSETIRDLANSRKPVATFDCILRWVADAANHVFPLPAPNRVKKLLPDDAAERRSGNCQYPIYAYRVTPITDESMALPRP